MGNIVSFLKSTRPAQNVFFVFIILSGVFIGGDFNVITLIMKFLVVTFIWQFIVVLNNIYDSDIDRVQKRVTPTTSGKICDKTYKKFALIFAVISLIFSFMLGPYITFLCILFLIAGASYSMPPLRFRRYIIGTCFIGIGAVLAFHIGYYKINTVIPVLSENVIFFSVLLFVSLSIGSNIKDLKDYEGDKKSGVRNIFTIHGPEKGKKISTVLLFFSFLTPLLLFRSPFDYLFFFFVALTSSVIFQKTEDQRIVIGLSSLIIFISMIKLVFMA